jgi:hypothetical protein
MPHYLRKNVIGRREWKIKEKERTEIADERNWKRVATMTNIGTCQI